MKFSIENIEEPANLKAVADSILKQPTVASEIYTSGKLGKGNANEVSIEFKQKGDLIFLLGESLDDISSSVYLKSFHGIADSPEAHSNEELGNAVKEMVNDLTAQQLINAAHDVTEGGVYATLVEMSIPLGLGFDIEADGDVRLDAFLFGESKGRKIVAVSEDCEDQFIEYLSTIEVPSTLLGHVTKGKLVVDGEHYGFISDAQAILDSSF